MGGRWASGLPYMDITKKDAIQTGVRLDLAQVDVADLNVRFLLTCALMHAALPFAVLL